MRQKPLPRPYCGLLVVLAWIMIASGPGQVPTVLAHGGDHAGLTAGYRLADTWQDAAWAPRPGHFGDAGDVAGARDGRIYVLDRQLNAVHELGADGQPRDLLLNPTAVDPQGPWRWTRLDLGLDGRPHLLARGVFEGETPQTTEVRYRVDVLQPGSQPGQPFELTSIDLGRVTPERYVDLAVASDGRVFVVRTNGNVASRGDVSYAVDILDIEQGSREVWVPDSLYIPLQIEVDSGGRVYLIDQFPHSSQNQPPGTVDGVHVYGADLEPLEVIRFSGAMDVAVAGDGSIYVTRNREIYRLGQAQPFHIGPPIQKNPYALTPLGVPEMYSLDVDPDGRPLAVMSHCSWQGLLIFDPDRIEAESPDPLVLRSGAMDLPALAGPVHPYRIAADRQVSLLQARYESLLWEDAPETFEPEPGQTKPIVPDGGSSQLYTTDPQTVQRWEAGSLTSQAGACGVWNAPFGVRDLAVDGDDRWTLDFQAIKRRSGKLPEPEPTFGFQFVDDLLSTPHLLAIDADDGSAAVLDAGSQSVALIDGGMRNLANWSYAMREGDTWAPTDIAMAGERVALAARGERRVTVFDRSGQATAQWWEDRPIRALALGPGEALFILTDGGWLMRRAMDGDHQAMWRLPDLRVSARDLAVDRQGRVYVPWVDIVPASTADIDLSQSYRLADAGIWVFETSLAYAQPVPGFVAKIERPSPAGDPTACFVVAGKHAEPSVVELGEVVRVELSLESECALPDRDLRLVLVVDSSKSMNNDNALDRAKQALVSLMGRLDPISSTELAVIAYDGAGGARLLAPFSEDISRARQAVAELEASGGTGLGTALNLAAGLLQETGVAGDRSALVWATDGETLSLGDDPSLGLQALREAGVPVYAQLHPFRFIRDAQVSALRGMLDPGRVWSHHGPESLDAQADTLYRRVPDPTRLALERLQVVETLAEDMDYIDGSAQPPAVWNSGLHRLVWTLEDPATSGPITLGYALQPRAIGSWRPVSQASTARFELDGSAGTVGFPHPALQVRGLGSALLPALRWDED